METVKDPVSVLPAGGKQCAFETGRDPSGKRLTCSRGATMKLDTVPLCDGHAEYKMTSVCGRAVKIERGAK